MPDFSNVALCVRKGSIRMLQAPVSRRKQEWPNQVIFMRLHPLMLLA